jgi:hypothetical protein
VDPLILLTSRVLAGRDSNGHREYPRPVRKSLRGNQTEKIHLLCQDLRLHEHRQSASRIGNSGISRRGLANKPWTTSTFPSDAGDVTSTTTSTEIAPSSKQSTKPSEPAQKDGFTTVASKKRNPPRRQTQGQTQNLVTRNSYEILNQLPEEEEILDPHKNLQQSQEKPLNPTPPPKSQEPNTEDRGEGDGDTPMQLDERDLAGIDLEKLEEALNQKDLQTLPEEQLRKVHKVFLNSSAGSTARLGIATDSNSGSKKIPRENKRRGRKTAQQLIKEAGNLMINSGQIHKISEVYLQPPPSTQ